MLGGLTKPLEEKGECPEAGRLPAAPPSGPREAGLSLEPLPPPAPRVPPQAAMELRWVQKAPEGMCSHVLVFRWFPKPVLSSLQTQNQPGDTHTSDPQSDRHRSTALWPEACFSLLLLWAGSFPPRVRWRLTRRPRPGHRCSGSADGREALPGHDPAGGTRRCWEGGGRAPGRCSRGLGLPAMQRWPPTSTTPTLFPGPGRAPGAAFLRGQRGVSPVPASSCLELRAHWQDDPSKRGHRGTPACSPSAGPRATTALRSPPVVQSESLCLSVPPFHRLRPRGLQSLPTADPAGGDMVGTGSTARETTVRLFTGEPTFLAAGFV